MVAIYGFTLIRNGLKYDYCFLESLESLSCVGQKIYLALGKGEDDTEKVVQQLPYLNIIPTIWDEKSRAGGIILSQQTNIALDALKSAHGSEDESWGIYLQGDEVFHEEDYQLIKQDIEKAQATGCDAISFRYLHFWKTHHHLAINKKWYPQEIRGIKLNSNIESWGDAQSFKNYTKVYESEARVFHYGHVRNLRSYQEKKTDILKLYHQDNRIAKYRRREKKFDEQTECLLFFGNHPLVMKERVLKLNDIWELDTVEDVYIKANHSQLTKELIAKVNAKNIHWVDRVNQVPKNKRDRLVILNPSWWERLLFKSNVPKKMRSKLARIWSLDFIFQLKLYEKRIGLRC